MQCAVRTSPHPTAMIHDVPLIASNAVTIMLSSAILLLKLRHG
jgi:hypothetical protein